ncbi:hypothetical protein [Streptomyces sp. CRN 30]|uniref:hypothetical protein n=1 Tax=Streptomyces sp. CRN 30 TaxID=3075613 RepID=UPI002A80CA71|nr:hypothetical protein [Streptomyces sp. CRN 30]
MRRSPFARALLVTALLPAALLLGDGTARAGATCHATRVHAPVHAGDSPATKVVRYLDPGVPVNGTRQGADDMWRVSRPADDTRLGYMRPDDLTCQAG